jgi:hypothetical protein
MPVMFDQVEGQVVGERSPRDAGTAPGAQAATPANNVEDLLREIARNRRIEERLEAD